jgi:eukaryotic-like serine/threonine-protein kinase
MPIPKKIGRFEILDELGHGPMSVDYRANDPATGRVVVLTVPSAGAVDSPNLLRRFYHEARAAGGLQHPNIAAIYDLGSDRGNPYIARELLEGEDLGEILEREKKTKGQSFQSAATMLGYIVQAGRGLGYAHQRGIVHRDVRPRSIFVTRNGTVKLTHFVNARLHEASSPISGGMTGGRMDYTYMSPEQIRGERLNGLVDIWALGCTMHEVLTYKTPFLDENDNATMFAIMSEEPDPMSELRPDLPAELDAVLGKALKKDRNERYKNMEKMLADLEPVVQRMQAAK